MWGNVEWTQRGQDSTEEMVEWLLGPTKNTKNGPAEQTLEYFFPYDGADKTGGGGANLPPRVLIAGGNYEYEAEGRSSQVRDNGRTPYERTYESEESSETEGSQD